MKLMSFRKLLPLFAVFALIYVCPARAQFAIYGTVAGERMSGFTCQAVNNQCASNDGAVRPFGSNFGVYYDFRSVGPVRLGADLRGSYLSYNKSAVEYLGGAGVVKQYGALGGVRGSIGTPIRILHPYAEALVGFAKMNAASTNPQIYSNYTQVQGFIGADVAIAPYLDIRAIEFGAGALFGPDTHGTQSIGAGLVFHMPR